MSDDEGLEKISPKPIGWVKQFYRDLLMVLTEPTHFFETRYAQTTFTYALTFGILVNWIAAFLSYLTRIIRHETLFDGFMKMREKLQELPFWKNVPESFWAQNSPAQTTMLPPWLIELFGIILSPFQSLFGIVCYAIVIFIGIYLLVPKNNEPPRDELELKNAVRVVSFTAAPVLVSAILGFLPIGLGAFIGWIYSLVLLMVGLSVRFRVSKLRAFGIVALPGIISIFAIVCVIGVFAALFFGIFASVFGS